MNAVVNVLFLAAEAEPFIKIGGLADVAGSLPLALRSLPSNKDPFCELDVRLVLPFYKNLHINIDPEPVAEFKVHRKGGDITARVFETSQSGMPVYLIDGGFISGSDTVYSADCAWDREKFAFFSLAALELTHQLGWKPDILHANDWHTSLALYALHSRQGQTSEKRIHTILTIHNLSYTGGDGSDVVMAYGLEPAPQTTLPDWASCHLLSLGLLSADAIVTVSPTYAQEILTPEQGNGLESFFKPAPLISPGS